MPCELYILKCSDGSYYTGVSDDLVRRLREHNGKKNRFTKSRLPVKLIYSEQHENKSIALKREKQIKSWKDRKAIDKLISEGPSSNGQDARFSSW